jgi:hypothetical protein
VSLQIDPFSTGTRKSEIPGETQIHHTCRNSVETRKSAMPCHIRFSEAPGAGAACRRPDDLIPAVPWNAPAR